jgi:hypothetical protein
MVCDALPVARRHVSHAIRSTTVRSIAHGLIRSVVELRGDRGSFSMQPWGNAKRFAFITYQELPGNAP